MKPSILFVDDESLVLKGLARSLRGQHVSWDIYFANSGPLALEFMAQQQVDVVVTDMRMPEMDGADLLLKVQETYPHVIRFILSGQCDKETILRSVGPSHQYLSKPCDTEDLIAKIENVLVLKEKLSSSSLQTVVSRLKTLFVLPEKSQALTDLLMKENCSLKEIGQFIEQEPSLYTFYAKILQLTNSGFFGVGKNFHTLREAIRFLGLDTIKALVLNFGILQHFDPQKYSWFDFNSFSTHALKVGKMARLIALKEGFSTADADNTFLAGLLHNIGILVLAEGMPDVFGPLLTESLQDKKDLFLLEQNEWQATHCDVGAYLLGLWGLSHPIVESAAYYHRPSLCASKKSGALMCVHAACVLTQELEGGEFPDSKMNLDEAYLKSISRFDRVSDWRGLLKESSDDQKSAICG